MLDKEIKGFINCLDFTIEQNGIKRDIFENTISNLILKGEIYMILFSLYLELHEEKINKIKIFIKVLMLWIICLISKC